MLTIAAMIIVLGRFVFRMPTFAVESFKHNTTIFPYVWLHSSCTPFELVACVCVGDGVCVREIKCEPQYGIL